MCFDASNFGEFTDASVFYWFSLLLKTIANTIIKAIAMVVMARSPENNM